MKRLLFSFAIMLFASAAATTAWGEPTEQETKDFIVSTLNKCGTQSRNTSWSDTLATAELVSAEFDGAILAITEGYSWNPNVTQRIPLDKVSNVHSYDADSDEKILAVGGHLFAKVQFDCLGSEGACVDNSNGRFATGAISACSETTNATLTKAFNHLIGIYKAQRPKPLFE